MTTKRWTPADLSLARQALALGKAANIVAKGSSYATTKAEQQEQMWFVEWCHAQTIDLVDIEGDPFSIRLDAALVGYPGGAFLSGNKKRRGMQWALLRKMGCKAGVTDLVLNVPMNGWHGMHLEMKKRRDQFRCPNDAANALSTQQTAYLHLMRRLGYFTGVAFGWIEAAAKTCTYLGWNPTKRGIEDDKILTITGMQKI